MGTQVACKVLTSLKKEGETDSPIPLGDAKQRIVDAGLWTPRGQEKSKGTKKDDLLPLRSLTKKDFEEKDEKKLLARILAVAKELGDTTARGRIGSLKLMAEGIDTFDKWWQNANPPDKSRLLADAKHWKTFTRDDHVAVATLVRECPFRGSVPTPTPEEDDEEDEVVPEAKASRTPSPKTQNGK